MPALARPEPARAVNGYRVWLLALLTLAGVSLLVGLGIWQLERRDWKLQLIRTVESRIHAPVHEIPAAAAANPAGHVYEHVQVTGTYLPGADTWVHATTELGAGYWVLSPLRTADGSVVLINRGFVAMDVAREAVLEGSSARITGLLRASEAGGAWPRRNEPGQERWYSRDIPAIAAARGLGPVKPYFVDAESTLADGDLIGNEGSRDGSVTRQVRPTPGLTVVQFRNTHLSYALTWFTLALMTALAGAYAVRGEILGHARRA